MKIELNEPSLKGEIDDTTFDDNGWSFHSDPDELSSPLPSPDFIDGKLPLYIFFSRWNISTTGSNIKIIIWFVA